MSAFIPDSFQQQVINLSNPRALVLAPPGCGKTQILTQRVNVALSNGIDPQEMLCLTFTNRAARGMVDRINKNVNTNTNNLFVGNVHRYCSKFLFENNIVSPNVSIIDDEDAIAIIAGILNDDEEAVAVSNVRRQQYFKAIQLSAFVYQLEHNHPKNLRLHPECFTSEDILALKALALGEKKELTANYMLHVYYHCDTYTLAIDQDQFSYGLTKMISALLLKMRVAKMYKLYKLDHNLIDFEDLLLFTYNEYKCDTNNKYKRYSWVQVDEVQDLNALQLAIIENITTPQNSQILYFGDEQQAIFSFMGAKMSTLNMLKEKCQDNIFHLFTNHRSPEYILNVLNVYAENVLNINKEYLPKANKNVQPIGNELQIITSGTIEEEKRDVTIMTKKLLEQYPTERVAIIVNSNADANYISDELNTMDVPHFKVSGEDLFSSATIKLLFAHLAVVANEYNFIAWARILKNIGVFKQNATAQRFVKTLLENAISPIDLLNDGEQTYIQQFVENYNNNELIVFDTETTGLNVLEDDIVQIAAVKIKNGKIVENGRFEVFIKTNKTIPTMLGEIENPIIEELKKHTLYEPSQALQMFLNFAKGSILVAHNATYDYEILRNNILHYLPNENIVNQHPLYFDTLKIMHLLKPNLENYKLKSLLQTFNIEGQNSHLADDDVYATVGVINYAYSIATNTAQQQAKFLYNYKIIKIIHKFKALYAHSFFSTFNKINNWQSNLASSVMVDELIKFYNYITDNNIAPKIKNIDYIYNYVDNQIVDKENEHSLATQLSLHIAELNTLKEADLCSNNIVKEKVFVTTIHKAKGLEFENIIIYDATDGRYPNYYTREDKAMVLEDARKFYVALSRATKRIFVEYSSIRIDYSRNPHPRYITRFMTPILKFFS